MKNNLFAVGGMPLGNIYVSLIEKQYMWAGIVGFQQNTSLEYETKQDKLEHDLL